MICLPGQRITVRDWIKAEIEPWLAAHEPGQAWQALDGPYYSRPAQQRLRERAERLREQIQTSEFPDPRQRLVIAGIRSNQLLGTVSSYWISQETHWLASGIVLFDEANWGQGLGYEALGLWHDYLWQTHPAIVRLDLQTWSGNHGMMALALKLGYREEARFRRARIVAGEYYDGLGYGILREEWATRYPDGFAASLRGSGPVG